LPLLWFHELDNSGPILLALHLSLVPALLQAVSLPAERELLVSLQQAVPMVSLRRAFLRFRLTCYPTFVENL
jgi:hypothetical protein